VVISFWLCKYNLHACEAIILCAHELAEEDDGSISSGCHQETVVVVVVRFIH
jgi:hypothetical protein